MLLLHATAASPTDEGIFLRSFALGRVLCWLLLLFSFVFCLCFVSCFFGVFVFFGCVQTQGRGSGKWLIDQPTILFPYTACYTRWNLFWGLLALCLIANKHNLNTLCDTTSWSSPKFWRFVFWLSASCHTLQFTFVSGIVSALARLLTPSFAIPSKPHHFMKI